MKTIVCSEDAPKAVGPYSQAIITDNLIFTSGQIHLNPDGTLVSGSTEEKMHRIMKNLEAVLKEAGCTFSDVVKTSIYVTDMSIYGTINTVYSSYFKNNFPARETICVKALPLNADIEISMIAVKP